MIITGDNIEKYRLLALKSALMLETLGMKSRRFCASKMVREILGKSGIVGKRNKIQLLAQFKTYLATENL